MSDQQISRRFREIEDSLTPHMDSRQLTLLDRIAGLDPRRTGRGFADLGTDLVAALKEAAALPGAEPRRNFSRALIARLASTTMARAANFSITPKMLEKSRDWLPRLADFLESGEVGEEYWFCGDWFMKDFRFVTLLTVPAGGARVIDLYDGVGPKTALKLARQSPTAALSALRRPWFRLHAEGRDRSAFTEAGWDECAHEIAKLLKLHPKVAGMVGTTWYYDPALSKVSPRLTYLRRLPMDNGAFLVRHGTTAFDIRSATATSPTRRALYEAGQYVPVSCSMLWPREKLIAWADANPI